LPLDCPFKRMSGIGLSIIWALLTVNFDISWNNFIFFAVLFAVYLSLFEVSNLPQNIIFMLTQVRMQVLFKSSEVH
jgi:hypothetical protein